MDRPLGVAAKAVVARDGRILVLQRSAGSSHDPGLWELPGGKMEYGEVLTEALAREVTEETGVGVLVVGPILTWHFTKEPFWVTGVTFVCEYVDGEVELSSEHDDARWVEPAEALALPLSRSMGDQIEAYVASRAAGEAR